MDYNELSELATKRDIIINKLKSNEDLPTFSQFNQGSYSMFTGVEPLDKEYDIDVGLRFAVNKADYDPLDLKHTVYDILKNHTDYGAEIKKPCVTVTYKKNGDKAFHVDLVIYAYEDKDDIDQGMFLARGTNTDNMEWEPSDPIELKNKIMNLWEGDERDQYRRIIRYMKRWKNLKFNSTGNAEPPGIGITLLAYEYFQSANYDALEEKFIADDLEALTSFVKEIKNSFALKWSVDRNEFLYTIEYNLPVEPYTNVFYKMTDIQMNNFKSKIDTLLSDLQKVQNEIDVIEQCKLLNKIFGDDFEVPEKENESKAQQNFIPSSSESGKE